MESKGLFGESNFNKKTGKLNTFFNKGPNNRWENLVNKKIIEDLEKNFLNEMKELNYIS